MSNDIDERLIEGLARTAATAPTLRCDVSDITTLAGRRSRRRRAMARGVLTVAAVAAGISGLVAMRTLRTDDAPPGRAVAERPLTRLSHAPSGGEPSPTKPGAVALQLADGQHVTFAITGAAFYDGYAQRTWVQYDTYGTGVAYADDAELPLIPRPELGGTETLTFWTGIPAAATRVDYLPVDGEAAWQAPVAGIAAFPATSHHADDTLIAYDADGNEVARVSWSATHLESNVQVDGGPMRANYSSLPALGADEYGPVDPTKAGDLDRAATEAYTGFADATMYACLSTDGDEAWTACIQSTDAAVKDYLDALATNP